MLVIKERLFYLLLLLKGSRKQSEGCISDTVRSGQRYCLTVGSRADTLRRDQRVGQTQDADNT